MSSVDPDARTISLEEVEESTLDESLWGRDPFDVIAALEEELGEPLWSTHMSG